MKDYDEVMLKQEEFENRLLDALIYGTADEARSILKEGHKVDPKWTMKSIVRHCYDLEKFELIKEVGYKLEGDQKCLEEYTKSGALIPKLAQYLLDNGAVISWKAIQNCADRFDLEMLRLLVNVKEDFFPID